MRCVVPGPVKERDDSAQEEKESKSLDSGDSEGGHEASHTPSPAQGIIWAVAHYPADAKKRDGVGDPQ